MIGTDEIQDMLTTGGTVVVPYETSTVTGAPRVEDADGHLSESEEAELYRYHGDRPARARTTTTAGHPPSVVSRRVTTGSDRPLPPERPGPASKEQ